MLLLLLLDFPIPSWSDISDRLQKCAGCHQSPLVMPTTNKTKIHILTCTFASSGFDTTKGVMAPCGAVYHSCFIAVGHSFTTRRNKNNGLVFPKVEFWPNFVCEVCTVRAVTQRELNGPNDHTLLVLERIRMIDMAWSWSSGTHATYQSQLRHIRRFEKEHALQVLRTPSLLSPPSSPVISLMWYMEAHSTRQTCHSSRDMELDQISFASVRALRQKLLNSGNHMPLLFYLLVH